MRISIAYPGKIQLDDFLKSQQKTTFSYLKIGYTKLEIMQTSKTPEGYTEDYYFIKLGKGDLTWQKAKEALKHWKHFPASFTKIYPDTTKIVEGNIVLVMIKILGFWWRNPAKIVYTFDEAQTPKTPNRFGFAYGTLQEHAEQGEEAFWISRDKDNIVTYHIHAISKPKFWAAKVAYPLTRMYQRKFAQESMQQMKNICTT